MSAIKTQIQEDLKEAMKNKDNFKRDTLRMVMSAFKQIEVDERKELSDEDIIKILQKAIKQREEAAAQYKEGAREDLMQKELDEAEIIKAYLPAQLSDEELDSIIKEIIASIGATSIKEIGKVMGAAISKVGGKADSKRINEAAKKVLS